MKKTLFIVFSFLSFSTASVAQVISFDALALDSASYWNGSDLSGVYEEEGFSFGNSFDTAWYSWSGFSVSNITDNVTEGWGNQYGVSAGTAYNGANFAIATMGASISTEAKVIDGFYITNSTYAALSMLNGDDFAKKFGGESGDDADWFKLSVIGKLDGVVTDTVNFYLADYRFEDNTQDYIVTDWTWLNLNALGNVTEISFAWSSSDNGEWGMNTPAYFCMDYLSVNTLSIKEPSLETLAVYPNPVQDQISVNIDGVLTIYNIAGTMVKSEIVEVGSKVSVNELASGIYFVKVGSLVQKIVKQ